MGTALSIIEANVMRNLGDPNFQFYTSAEIRQYIGEAYKKYCMPMIEEGQGYFEATVNVGFTSGNPYIDVSDLPGIDATLRPFYSISQFERWLSNGSSVPLRLSERRFKVNTTIAVSSGDAYRPTYKQQGMRIVLEPTPTSTDAPTFNGQATSGMKLDYNYVPDFPTANSADSFEFDGNFPVTWEPLIELYATIRALEGKDAVGGVSDVATFRQTLAQFETDFMDSLQRDETPESVEQAGMDYGFNIFSGGYY